MKIINDTEVFEPDECLFCVQDDPDGGTMVSITDKDYWNTEHFLNDGFGDHSLDRGVVQNMARNGITGAMEAMWTSEDDLNKVRSLMLSFGFIESKEMCDALDEWSQG